MTGIGKGNRNKEHDLEEQNRHLENQECMYNMVSVGLFVFYAVTLAILHANSQYMAFISFPFMKSSSLG